MHNIEDTNQTAGTGRTESIVPAVVDDSSTTQPQAERIDTGLVCLVMLARFHDIATEPEQLQHEFGLGDQPFNTEQILHAAKKLGLTAKVAERQIDRLNTTPLPAIICKKDGGYTILAKIQEAEPSAQQPAAQGRKFLVHDPLVQRPQLIDERALLEQWSGQIILLTSKLQFAGETAQFDFSWFIPAVIKYRKLLLEVLAVSLGIQLFALITPLFFQVVMDKVLVHRAFSTLDVIAVGLFFITLFDVALNGLRSYVFAHTSSRIDVELGARLFRHLLSLPLAYFQARRVGDSVARVRELENIRSFLTGNAITIVLDLVFSVIFILVMLYYSRTLTLVVVASLPCYFLISLFFTPILKKRLDDKFNRGAENQAFLVESISGIDTVKAMAVEPQWLRKWDAQLAGYVTAGFRTTSISIFANNGVTLVSKLVTLVLMWLGAKLVIEGQLSIGQLIAFNMLSGQVSTPVMRLAQLWTDFQQVGISMSRLGDILNAPTESSTSKGVLQQINGKIDFDQVLFRYRPDGPEILKKINLNIKAGEVIGIVGSSGSGKSTLAKLVQRLFVSESGRVMIDDIDISLIEASSLRRQIGVVLQENVLFNRSIRENIALADPGAPLDPVIRAAKLSGAHQFISNLQEGYDTMVGEHGVGLSGGQRQRIAIARALLHNPRILIFDEATSALDYESERAIQDNMKLICQGRTVLIIAHRLSAVRDANRIVVMENGSIIEQGSHAELLQISGGRYAHLYSLQQA